MDNVKRIELKDTVLMMTSEDYKERFKAEYYQNIIRYNKLLHMLQKWDKGQLDFVPICSREIYDQQIDAMKRYIEILKFRAKQEMVVL